MIFQKPRVGHRALAYPLAAAARPCLLHRLRPLAAAARALRRRAHLFCVDWELAAHRVLRSPVVLEVNTCDPLCELEEQLTEPQAEQPVSEQEDAVFNGQCKGGRSEAPKHELRA